MDLMKLDKQKLTKTLKGNLHKCNQTMKLWKHSRSSNMLKCMTIGGEYTNLRRLRQVSAEMSSKKQALIEASYNVRSKKIEIKEIQQQLKTKSKGLKYAKNCLSIEKLESEIEQVETPFIGAMQEIASLAEMHDNLKEQIVKEYGKFDEEVFELDEKVYWVRRGFAQSMRDVRECGVIKNGNQELLEQIGINPSTALTLIKEHLSNTQSKNMSNDVNENFLVEVSNMAHTLNSDRIKRLGFEVEANTDHLQVEGEE